jgi:nucleoside-diphosphate-sugar epimerase
MKQSKSVLIIGVNSLLSVSIIKQLKNMLNYTFDIIGVFNKNTNNTKDLGIKQITFEKYLQTDYNFDFVFIVAAHIPYDNPLYLDKSLIDKNILLVSQISKKNKNAKLIFCSSVSVYGNNNNTEILETTLPNPQTAYSISKITGEYICQLHDKYAIVRLSSIYGKGINSPTFIPRVIKQSKNTKEIVLYGNGSRKQNYIHVDDAANYLIKSAFHNTNGIFLGTSKNEYSNLEISEIVKRSSKNNTKIVFKGDDNSKNSIYNCTKTIETLKIKSEIEIEVGIKEMML